MRAIYAEHARAHNIKFRRNYTPGEVDETDPVNAALTCANTALYGIVAAALSSLGIPHGLGIIHTGHRESLVYDFADLYKAQLTIPLAFEIATTPCRGLTIDQRVRRRFRRDLLGLRLLPRLTRDIYAAYGEDPGTVDHIPPLMNLWDDQGHDVPTGTNWSTTEPDW